VIKFRPFILVFLVFVEVLTFQHEVFAQKENKKKKPNVFLHPEKFYKKFFPGLKLKQNPPDSLFIKTYLTHLSVGVHLQSPSIRMDISPGNANAIGASKFRTNIADIVGFNVGYKLVAAGFSFLLKSGMDAHDNYAKSYYRTATIKYNSGVYSFQFMYLNLKGLTDVNPSNNLDPKPYIERPDIVNKEYKFEWIYNSSWKKYSYIAPFTFTQRQLKSRIGFLLKAGTYYTQLSGDSALIGRSQQRYYDDFNNVRVIRTVSIRLAPGAGGNFIFYKHCYLSVAFFPSYDLYLYKYLTDPNEKVKGKQTFVFVLDSKAGLGYQSERLYAGLRYEIERKHASLHSIQTNNVYIYTGLEVGYRFNAPRFLKKMYKETMPPGM
jgi:hypothetical protein